MDGKNAEPCGAMTNARSEQTVTIDRSALREAIKQAERAVDEVHAQRRDAQAERDELARKLGSLQDLIDRLDAETERRTQHVRRLLAAGAPPFPSDPNQI